MSKIGEEMVSSVFKEHKKSLISYLEIEHIKKYSKAVDLNDTDIEFIDASNSLVYSLDIQTVQFPDHVYTEQVELPNPNRGGGCKVSAADDRRYGYDFKKCYVKNRSEMNLPDEFKYKKIYIGYIIKDSERLAVSSLLKYVFQK